MPQQRAGVLSAAATVHVGEYAGLCLFLPGMMPSAPPVYPLDAIPLETVDRSSDALQLHELASAWTVCQTAARCFVVLLFANGISSWRVISNRYLLTINAALVALYGLQSANFGQSYWTLLITVIGIPVSLLWYLIIKSHADLNRIKFDVIHKFEQHLPAAMYRYEWKLAEEGQGKPESTEGGRRVSVLKAARRCSCASGIMVLQ